MFQQMFHHSVAIMLLIDPNTGRLCDVNASAVDYYGYDRDSLLSCNISDINILPKADIQREMEAALKEKRNFFRFQHRLADGRVRDVEVYSSPVNFGNETRLVSIIHDVTARNDHERELEILMDVVENLPVGIYRSSVNGKGRFLSVNNEMVRLSEADSVEHLLATPVSALYAETADRKIFLERLERADDWYTQTVKVRTLKGRVGHFRISVRKRYLESGELFVDGVMEDLNRVRAAEQDRQQLFEIIEATPAIIGISDPDGRLRFLNTAGRRVLGIGPEDSLEGFMTRQAHTEESLKTLTETAMPAAKAQGQWSGELCYRDTKGKELPVQTTLLAHRNEEGELIRFSAISLDVRVQKEKQAVLEQMAYRDSLTAVLNRRGFQRALKAALDEARNSQDPLAVLMIDLDHFKPINDRYGHPVGDEILRKLMPFLRSRRRRGDHIGRLGGEEFGIVLPGSSQADAIQIAEDIRERVAAAPITTSAGDIAITISVGVATFDDRREAGKSLIRRADEALYDAKEAGRNCVRWR
ncbi:diguanylate cyclase [Gammaproteobacteria bacterium AB-CW1]|uniref:Diguanylate cyclase n=1 Tax=Natronospira elongata TaxID=3110268 RepID=A0AAP6JFU8_9GAMM|nr:diguanylate cyclase [Gammaproteobacteria bacterium AB-CW1]